MAPKKKLGQVTDEETEVIELCLKKCKSVSETAAILNRPNWQIQNVIDRDPELAKLYSE